MTINEIINKFYNEDEVNNLSNDIKQYYNTNPLRDILVDYGYIKEIITRLKSESAIKALKEINFNNNSIFDYIQKHIDLNDGIDGLLNNSNSPFWNESLASLIGYWQENVIPANALKNLTNENPEYIKQANSVIDFNSDYVNPKQNSSNQNFSNVLKVNNEYNMRIGLNNNKHYQETNIYSDQESIDTYHYLNLMMPKTTRRVEAADLDRNFWVIGRNISYLLEFLFKNENVFGEMFKNITKEITELWENIIYLWAALYAIYGHKNRDLHFEIMYLPNDTMCTSRKFDNFDFSSASLSAVEAIIKSRFDFMRKRYPRSNLCIMPIIRENNYEHNYYSIERYPGLLLKNYNEDNFHLVSFDNGSGSTMGVRVDENDNHTGLVFLNSIGYTDIDDAEYNCNYIFPFSQIDNFKELIPKTYTSAFRMTPEIKKDYSDGTLTITNITLRYDDVVGKSIKQINSLEQGTYYGNFKMNQNEFKYNFYSKNNPTSIKFKFNFAAAGQYYSKADSSQASIEETVRKKKGNFQEKFYLGECISNKQTTDYATFSLDKEIIDLRPAASNLNTLIIQDDDDVVNYTSGNLDAIIVKYKNNEWSRLVVNDGTITKIFAEDNNNISEELSADYSMILYVGDHPMNPWGETQNYTYWDYNTTKEKIQRSTVSTKEYFAYHLFHGAAIYNPVTENAIKYDDYCFYTYFPPDCNWSALNKDSILDGNTTTSRNWTGGHDDYAYYYVQKNNNNIGNNWAIRYIQTSYCLSYPNSELSSIKDTTNKYSLPSEFQDNKWTSATWDSSNPKTLNLNWDVYSIPDGIRETYQFDDGNGAMTYNQREQLHNSRILEWKNYYKSWIITQNNIGAIYIMKQNQKNYIERMALHGITIDENDTTNKYLPMNYITNSYTDSYFDNIHYYDFSDFYYSQIASAASETEALSYMPQVVTIQMLGKRYEQAGGYDDAGREISGVEVVNVGTGYIQARQQRRQYAITQIENENTNFSQWKNNFEKALANEHEKHWQGSKSINAYPVYSVITSHLFFADGRYASRSFIRTNGDNFDTEEQHTVWKYRIVDRNKQGCDYDELRALLPGYTDGLPGYDESVRINVTEDYILKDADNVRKRYVGNKWVNKKVDYERYLVNGLTYVTINKIE